MSLLAGLIIVAQTAQGPAATPLVPPAHDPATIDVSVEAALIADVMPRRDVFEMRPRIGVELTAAPRPWTTFKIDARVDALVADRDGRVADIRGEVRDAWVEVNAGAADVRAGFGRVTWGRLDEIAPTDVINPLDAGRFLFEGRSEARLPVSFVRGRIRTSDRLTLEGIVVPVFRRGVFDRLDEPTSPFNLLNDAVLGTPSAQRTSREPNLAWQNVSGGGRVDMTLGRVDVGVAAFRGFDGLGPISVEVQPTAAGDIGLVIVEEHPRFTMIGGDFETVTGPWALRGEAAVFTERSFSTTRVPGPNLGLVQGRSMDAGVGFDRRAGDFRVFGSGIFHREWSELAPDLDRTDFSIVGSIERSFDREHYFARVFSVVNPGDASAFVRAVLAWKPSDRWSLAGSGGGFIGEGDDAIGRFRTRDFLLLSFRSWLW